MVDAAGSSGRLGGPPPKQAKGAGRPGDDRDQMIAGLQRQLEEEKDKNRSLEDQIKYRVSSFVKRESQTKNKIETLERRMNDGTDHDEHMQRMAAIENMHKSVTGGLDCIQDNTVKILQDQEKDLMRAFRARLQDVSKVLEVERSKKGEHSTELQARHRRVVAELHEAQELAQTFEKKNQQLALENQKLTEKLNSGEDDRQCYLKELVLSRKEAARWKAQVKEEGGNGSQGGGSHQHSRGSVKGSVSSSGPRAFSQKALDQQRLQENRNQVYEREVRYREAIRRLKRVVEAEKGSVGALQDQQNTWLRARTELEVLLRQNLDDVKAEVARRKMESEKKEAQLPLGGRANSTIPGSISIHELDAQDRERVLELLLSQQRVVQLLYSGSFASANAGRGVQSPGGGAAAPEGRRSNRGAPDPNPVGNAVVAKDDFSWLSDIIPADS